jgi:hypothetical protein
MGDAWYEIAENSFSAILIRHSLKTMGGKRGICCRCCCIVLRRRYATVFRLDENRMNTVAQATPKHHPHGLGMPVVSPVVQRVV